MKHADTHNIFYPLQHGTWKGLSCETQLIEFVDDIRRNIDAGKQTDCLIMELMASNFFPFLNTGHIFAVFHMAGIVPDSYDILNMIKYWCYE
jgi:hypothetical protein